MKSVGAVVAGAVTMMVLVTLATLLAAKTLLTSTEGQAAPLLTPAYLAVNLAASSIFAVFGGYLTAHFAPDHLMRHVFVLAGLIAVLGIASALSASSHAGQPAWYGWTIVALGVTGVLCGGLIRSAT